MLEADVDTIEDSRIVSSIMALAERYDGLIVDGFGTLHHGASNARSSSDALDALIAMGRHVVVVVNSSIDHAEAANRLAAQGISLPPEVGLLSSTGLALELLRDASDPVYRALGDRCFPIVGDGLGELEALLPFTFVLEPLKADFILLTAVPPGPDGIEACRRWLTLARLQNLTAVCTNPDSVVLESDWLGRGPGSLARDYERSGGRVLWIGKPHAVIYLKALNQFHLPADRVLAVGDDIDVDIAGAREVGIDTALLTSGAHYDHFRHAATESDLRGGLRALLADNHARQAPRWLARTFAY